MTEDERSVLYCGLILGACRPAAPAVTASPVLRTEPQSALRLVPDGRVPHGAEWRDKSGCQYCDGYCHGGCREPQP